MQDGQNGSVSENLWLRPWYIEVRFLLTMTSTTNHFAIRMAPPLHWSYSAFSCSEGFVSGLWNVFIYILILFNIMFKFVVRRCDWKWLQHKVTLYRWCSVRLLRCSRFESKQKLQLTRTALDIRFGSVASMAQGSCSLLGAMDRPSFSSQMQANATPTSADACLSIVHSLMCHRQVGGVIAVMSFCCLDIT